MKKLIAIMMALVMCCSLVVSASAAKTYSGDCFSIKIDVDGDWEDYGEGYYEFVAEDGTCLEILVYSEDVLADEGLTAAEAYEEFLDAAYIAVEDMDPDEVGEFAEGDIDGYDAFILEELYDDYAVAMLFICADDCLIQIGLEGNGDDDIYNSLAESILDISIDAGAGSEVIVDEEEEEEEIEEDEEEIEEDEDDDKGGNKKPAKDDKDDEDEEDDDKKDDKKDKDDKDDEEKNNTTLIIIVAGVAVVAVAAVVIVLATKKKK